MQVAPVLMEILRAAGVRHLFGNPGTTELPFLDALPDSGLRGTDARYPEWRTATYKGVRV